MNKSQFIGNLAADAEVIQGANGEFVKFRLGVNDRHKNRAGDVVETTEWVNCTMSKNAVLPYLVKGKEVLVEGRIRAEVYKKKEGAEPGVALCLRVLELHLLGGKPTTGGGDSSVSTNGVTDQAMSKPAPVNLYRSQEEEEGDLPF